MDHAILTAQGVRKKHGALLLLDGIEFSLMPGTVTALLGPANAEKSALLQLAAGLNSPSSGSIRVLDNSPVSSAARAAVAYLPALSSLPAHLTVAELTRFYQSMFSDFDAEKATALFSELRVKTDKRIGAMSRSTREKVQLILTLSRRARLYLLDTPVSGTSAAKEFAIRLIREAKREDAAVLISANDPSDIEDLADRFLILSAGKILLSGGVDAYREEQGVTLTEGYRGMLS